MLGGTDLLFEQVKIVEQPFSGWRQPMVRLNCCRKNITNTHQCAFVRGQPCQKLVRTAFRRHCM